MATRRRPPALTRLALLFITIAGVAAACSASSSDTGASAGGVGGSSGGGSAASSTGQGGEGGAVSSASASSSASSSGLGGAASSSSASSSASSSGQGGALPCAQGTILCDGTVAKTCDGNGGFSAMNDCAPNVCVPNLGCATCVPGKGSCNGDISTVCKFDGSGYTTTACDADQGVTCDAVSGQCQGACAPQVIGESYIGCDYYPTVTSNVVSDDPFHYAVSVSNTTANPANVKITQGAATIATQTVAPNSVAVITLPWVAALKSAQTTTLVSAGAYRLRSDQPVSVYQYNPLEYTLSGSFSYTNDASILLPVNAWTGNYRVTSRQTLSSGLPGFYAVTASEDGTTVVLTPPAAGGGVSPGAGVSAMGAGTVTMNRGDVLEVFSGDGGNPGDLTGTLVAADKPVQIIGGHVCTYLPDPVCCCDHIEESVPPIETLGTEYIVTAPVITNAPVAEVVRFVATAANTTLTYDPPQPGAPAFIAAAGEFIEIVGSSADFKVTASDKILVTQYMEGEQAVGSGDPAMSVAVSIQQYRTDYLFHAPTNYDANFVNVTAPNGAAVTIDGVAVNGFVPIGNAGYSVARVPLSNAGSGTHAVLSPVPVGISVYGYGEYTSYWYPGGQNLNHF